MNAYSENFVEIGLVEELVKGGRELYGGWGTRGEGKNVFQYTNELLIWTHPENLVKIRLMVEEVVKGCKNFFPHCN